jgi:hypothetical protein
MRDVEVTVLAVGALGRPMANGGKLSRGIEEEGMPEIMPTLWTSE